MPRVHYEREAVGPERDRDRRVLRPDRDPLQVRHQQVLGSLQRAEVQRVVEIGERRAALELRPPAGGKRALGVNDVAPGQARRGERIPEARRRPRAADRSRPAAEWRASPAKNASARWGDAPSTEGALPATASGPVWFAPSRHSDTDDELWRLARYGRSDEPLELRHVAVSRVRQRGGRRKRRLDARERLGDERARVAHPEVEQPLLVARVRRGRDPDEHAGDDETDQQHADRQPERPPPAVRGRARSCCLPLALCPPRPLTPAPDTGPPSVIATPASSASKGTARAAARDARICPLGTRVAAFSPPSLQPPDAHPATSHSYAAGTEDSNI